MWTRALAGADASCGGKARGLASLIEAGLRVPAGFVIDDRAFRVATGDAVRRVIESGERSPMSVMAMHQAARSGPIDQRAIQEAEVEVGAILEPDPGISLLLRKAEPAQLGHDLEELARRIESTELPSDLVEEVATRARRLGGPFAVRSSATIEDGEAGTAAGVFSSRTAVPIEELWPAIRAVWTSALTPLAAAYARRRGGDIVIAVIVQKYVEGELVTVYTRPPGSPEANELWWQHDGVLSKTLREEGSTFLDAENAIGARAGADVELIVPRIHEPPEDPGSLDFERAWFVQARPIVHPVVEPRPAPPPMVLAPLQDGRRWTLDLAHNPDPLSTAQADLVDRVERAGAAPWSARVCAGYLYTTPRETPAVVPADSAADLDRRAGALELRMMAALQLDTVPTLGEALSRYVAFVRVWAHELGPLIAASRAAHPLPTGRTSAVERILLETARTGGRAESLLSTLGQLSPAWDVAVPTFAERPGLLRDALARARAVTRDTPAPLVEIAGDYAHAKMAAEFAERDDHVFAQAQLLVRRAIHERADALGIAREDAFWIPLDDLIAGIDPLEAGRRASGARAAATRATSWNMPIVVGASDSSTRNSGVALVGTGSGHQVSGRVRRFESLASAIVVGHGDIVVTRAVTPALAVIVIGCAAIISETGGVLDHGAAMARELGIPCVVGCRDAWTLLADGMIITVDGDQVTITR